ncbi:hypothetical protein [Nocardia sp. NPDC004415]
MREAHTYVGPWATRFDSENAITVAEGAARRAAIRDHDLNPILSMTEVYGQGCCSDRATAMGFDPCEPVAADGSSNYIRGDFDGGFIYSVYRPAEWVRSGNGHIVSTDLLNTTIWPYPGGRIDPTTVELDSLGLDIDGIDRRFINFCAAALGCEAAGDLDMLRPTFKSAWPDYVSTIRHGLLHMIESRPIDLSEWYDLTYIRFKDADAFARYIAQVYAFLFEGFDSMPVVNEC